MVDDGPCSQEARGRSFLTLQRRQKRIYPVPFPTVHGDVCVLGLGLYLRPFRTDLQDHPKRFKSPQPYQKLLNGKPVFILPPMWVEKDLHHGVFTGLDLSLIVALAFLLLQSSHWIHCYVSIKVVSRRSKTGITVESLRISLLGGRIFAKTW